MNNQELLNLVKQCGTFVFAIFVAHGYLTHDQATSLMGDLAVVIPALGSIGTIGWSVYSHWNMKKVPEAAKVVGALLLAFLLMEGYFGAPAMAADLPVKAPSFSAPAYPYDSSGFYFGPNLMAGIQQTSVSGNPLLVTSLVNGNLNAAGGSVGGTIGYTKGNAAFWWAVEDSLDYQNITATAASVVPASTVSRWSNETVVRVHGFNPLQYLPNLGITFPSFPTQLPVVPVGIAVGAAQLYIGGGVKEWGISGNFVGNGSQTYGVGGVLQAGSIAQIIDATGKPTGAALDLGAEVVFANKTLSVTTGGGTPLGQITSGNQYWAYTKVLW